MVESPRSTQSKSIVKSQSIPKLKSNKTFLLKMNPIKASKEDKIEIPLMSDI